MRVAVVGAGAVGVTAAHALAERGADVTLFEVGEVASGASGRAAGVCYDAFADRVDAELADRALSRFRDPSGTGEFTFTDCPYVWLAREGDGRHARGIREGVKRMCAHDRDVSVLSPRSFAERFPALEADIEVAAVAEDAGYADPAAYTQAMAGLAERAGAAVRTHAPAEVREGPAVETPDGTESFDACEGYEERAFGASLPVERAWAGFCTATPDRHPLVGALPGAEGVYVATGWQGHGFMRAPAIGERLAVQVLGGERIPAFDLGRFDGGESFETVEEMAVEERLSKGE